MSEPELSHTRSGVAVCRLRVAVNRIPSAEARAQGTQSEADFFDVSAWRQSGEYAAQCLNKGRLVLVAGKMQLRDYTDHEGIQTPAHESEKSYAKLLLYLPWRFLAIINKRFRIPESALSNTK